MFDQLFDSFRKASEASLQAQQEMFRQWVQQWPAAPLSGGNVSPDWAEMQRRWVEATTDSLNRHRALLDTTYRSGIEVIERSFRVSEAKNPEDYRRLVEELWRKLSDTFRSQSEAMFREFQGATEKWVEKSQNAAPS